MKLSDKVQQSIKEMICNKEYNAEGYLLSEGDLAERFSVSRSTVREAIRSLETCGYVSRVHGKGVKVVENSNQALHRSLADFIERGDISSREMLATRQVIEGGMMPLVVEQITDEELGQLDQLVKKMESCDETSAQWMQLDLEFHILISQATHNALLIALVSSYTPLMSEQIYAMQTDKGFISRIHRTIVDALYTRDAHTAVMAMRRHFEECRGTYLAQ